MSATYTKPSTVLNVPHPSNEIRIVRHFVPTCQSRELVRNLIAIHYQAN